VSGAAIGTALIRKKLRKTPQVLKKDRPVFPGEGGAVPRLPIVVLQAAVVAGPLFDTSISVSVSRKIRDKQGRSIRLYYKAICLYFLSVLTENSVCFILECFASTLQIIHNLI